MNGWNVKVHAPGKLILSGEHAVVYGAPALAIAVNRYAMASITPQLLPVVSFDLADLAYEHGLTFAELNHLRGRIKNNYQQFTSGSFKIRDVLQTPVELVQFAFSLFLESRNLKVTEGIKLSLQSNIPIGCGMGSSAATILSILHAIAHYLQVELSSGDFFQLALEAENMQHGYSSGLDVKMSLRGGCVFKKNGQLYQRSIPQLAMYLVNTGMPKTTTGECVQHASKYFKESRIADDFAAVTETIDAELQTNNLAEIKRAIIANHELLINIGVVPVTVQQFINEVKKFEGAAKICGAGAVSGENAGVVLVVTENKEALAKLSAQYNYSILPITVEPRGVHIV